MLAIRRASLDAFWSRERSTVAQNRMQGLRYMATNSTLGWDNPYPARGPFPIADVVGMKIATNILLRSLDSGINSQSIQYETMRKLRSHISNFVHTTPGGLGVTFMTEEGAGGTVSFSPTNSPWFRRFMQGCHRRMGDVWIPDRPLTINELKCCMELLEEDWKLFSRDIEGQANVCFAAITVIAGFFAALRGEEIVRLDLGLLNKHWEESMAHPDAHHVPLMLTGRFKRQVGEKSFCQPLALCSNSGIKICMWFERARATMSRRGVTVGPFFRMAARTEGGYKRASMGDLQPGFHAILLRVQERWPNIIPHTVNVTEEYSVSRSLRRGATSHAQNMKVPREVIEANNRWRKQSRANGLMPNMTMMERYSDAKASVPLLIRFSQEL